MPDLKDLLIKELHQTGLLLATKIHKDEFKKLGFKMSTISPDDAPSVKVVYERARAFSGIECPKCWVRDGNKSALIIEEPIRGNVDHYKCKNCDFEHHFTKSIL